MRLLLQGGRVIDPSQGWDGPRNLLIADGRIVGAEEPLPETNPALPRGAPPEKTEVLDLRGCLVVPGLIDMHVHLREPGFEAKETIRTGSEAAVAGGFTAVACMPNTQPVNDDPALTTWIRQRAAEAGLARVYPVAAITAGSRGEALSDFASLRNAGAVAFSDDGRPVMNAAVMRQALEQAAVLGLPVLSHCEDLHLSGRGVMNEGARSAMLGLPGAPSVAEEVMVARDILLAEYAGATVHIAHVSTAGSVRLIREAKARGVRVTAETAPQYFCLTENAVGEGEPNARVNPPLRTERDRDAVKEGLRDGTLDAIASDHAPHARQDKEAGFAAAASGMVGLETSLSLSLRLVAEGILTFSGLVRALSVAPARILGVPGGTLRVGAAADVTVIDPQRPWTVEAGRFRSRSRNTPFEGWAVQGKAVLTVVGGVVRFREG